MSSPILSALRATAYFGDLTAERLAPLVAAGELRTVRRGETGALADTEHPATMILASGAAQVVRTATGDRSIGVSLLEADDLFGPLPGSGSPAASERVQFLAPSQVLSIPVSAFEAVMLAEPAVALRVIVTVSRRLAAVERHLIATGSKPVAARVAAILVEVGDRYGTASEGEVLVDLSLTHGQIAELAATTRETVTKVLSWLRRRGIVLITRREIRIADPRALHEISAGTRPMPGRLAAAT